MKFRVCRMPASRRMEGFECSFLQGSYGITVGRRGISFYLPGRCFGYDRSCGFWAIRA